MLDDSEFDRTRIKRLSYKNDFAEQIDEVGNIGELAVAVQGVVYDVITINYRLPNCDGIEALEQIMKTTRKRNAYKIMIGGDGTVDAAKRAMSAGCHRFLTKYAMNAGCCETP